MNVDANDEADGWVDRLLESARKSTKATAEGIQDMAGDIAEVGGAVAKLADAVTRMAATCEKTKTHATDAKHAVTAADWFWRQVKSVLSKHKKAIAGGMACLWFGFGGQPATSGLPPIGGKVDAEVLIHAGRYEQAERWIGDHWEELGEGQAMWLLARCKKLQGKDDAADTLLNAAAQFGHADAIVICRR